MTWPIMAIIPYPLKMTMLCFAAFEVIVHSAYLTLEAGWLSLLKGVIKTPIPNIVLPFNINLKIAKFLSFIHGDFVHIVFIILYSCFEMITPILYTNWAKSYYKVVAEEIFTNFYFQERALISKDYQEAMMYREYLIEWRKEAGVWTIGFILFINFEKIISFLRFFNKSISNKSGKLQIAKFLTHPMLTIVYISLLLYLEAHNSILFTFWILYTTLILFKELIEYFAQAPLEMIFLSCILIVIFLVLVTHSVLFWNSLFPIVTMFTLMSFRF